MRNGGIALLVAGFSLAWVACAQRAPGPATNAATLLASRGAVPISRGVGPSVAETIPAATSIVVDGVASDEEWKSAPVHSGFWQQQPNEGDAATFRTEFRVLYDANAIYVAVRGFDPQPQLIAKRLTRRDDDSSSDWIYVSFDSYLDRRTAFSFGINAAGVQRDLLKFDDTNADPGWNAVWEGAAKIDGEGWVAEFRIPFSQLRFSGTAEQLWGLQVTRFVQRANEFSMWAPQPRDSGRDVSLFGSLRGLRELGSPRRIELLPYGTIGATRQRTDSADPLNSNGELLSGAGLDFKYGLGSNFTLSGAINPDFGQVEADPSEVNLSANESFFAEKRPFFLEGTDIFSGRLRTAGGGQDALFYSRRIGAAPHDTGDGYAPFYRDPGGTTILGAGKLSGKTEGGWSFGLLEAVTSEETTTLTDELDSDRSDRVIEPLTNFSVARVKRDFGAGETTIGAVATGVHRALEGTELTWLHRQAYAGGLEASHRFKQGTWSADLKLYGSHVRGDAEAIDETQRGPQRYFQRPDADHLDYDPTRTSLSGFAMSASAGKWNGGNWRFGAGFDTISPSFAVNDLGFQREGDKNLPWMWGQYWDGEPGEYLRTWQLNASLYGLWDHGGTNMTRGMDFNFNLNFTNYWHAFGGGNVADNRFSQTDLRGGPLLARDPTAVIWWGFGSDSRKSVSFQLNSNMFAAPANGSRGGNINPVLNWQAKSNLSFSAGPALAIGRDDNQYVEEVIGSDGETHYVMARIDQIGASMTLRANYTLSPTVSFQLYAQPFIATGEYSNYKDVVDPQASDYNDRYRTFTAAETTVADSSVMLDGDGDGVPDLTVALPDFSFGQLRSTFVTRWEYRPGSSLFLIWNHNRTSFTEEGQFGFSEDARELADEPGEHVFLLKLNYWFGV